MIYIDGIAYDVPVFKLKRTAEFLDKYAKRTEDGDLKRKLIGVYFNYELQIGRGNNYNEYKALWDKVTEPTEYHSVRVPDSNGEYTFTAYFASISDEAELIDGGNNYYSSMNIKFIAKAPARR